MKSTYEELGPGNHHKKKFVIILSIVGSILFLACGTLIYVLVAEGESNEIPPFGSKMKHEMFSLKQERHFMNHGGYGNTPIPIQEAESSWRLKMEEDTDRWFIHDFKEPLIDTRAKIGKYVGTSGDNIAILDNASTGINSVFRSYNFTSEDTILRLNFAYGMVINVVNFITQTTGAKLHELDLKFPNIDDDYIIETINATLVNDSSISFAVFSHITSVPSIILPVKRLVALCRTFNVKVIIDGAHALGQIPLDMEDIDADYYVANGHKWMYSPKGSAFLYVTPSLHQTVHPAVISNLGGFAAGFEWTGTRDYSAWLSMVNALQWREEIGGEQKIMNYNNDICSFAVSHFAERFGNTPLMPSHNYASLVTIKVPCNVEAKKGQQPSQVTSSQVTRAASDCYDYPLVDLQKKLDEENFSMIMFELHGIYYWRLSCQIYSEKSEIEMVATIIQKFSNL